MHTIHQEIVRDLEPNDLADGFEDCTSKLAKCTVTLNSRAAVQLNPDSHISPVLCDRYNSVYFMNDTGDSEHDVDLFYRLRKKTRYPGDREFRCLQEWYQNYIKPSLQGGSVTPFSDGKPYYTTDGIPHPSQGVMRYSDNGLYNKETVISEGLGLPATHVIDRSRSALVMNREYLSDFDAFLKQSYAIQQLFVDFDHIYSAPSRMRLEELERDLEEACAKMERVRTINSCTFNHKVLISKFLDKIKSSQGFSLHNAILRNDKFIFHQYLRNVESCLASRNN